uniref:Seroin4 n=1 Tax=Samia ricini TaxID=63990 RepID=A0A0M4U4B0_SAMRI|nr:seroin4 [Samia ricini]
MAFTKILLALSFVALSNAFLLWPNGASSFAGSKMFPSFPSFGNLFNPFSILPPIINPDDIKTHVAGPNEHFSAVSTSSHSFSSNVDGKVTEGGGMSTIVNDGKNVKESVLVYGDDDGDRDGDHDGNHDTDNDD